MGKRERTEDYFRKRLRDERNSRKWSQADMAKLLSDKGVHMHPTTIAKIEAGERSVRIDEATGIADLLGISLDVLLGRAAGLDDDLTYALRSLRNAARRWDAQVGPMLTELGDATTAVFAFNFDGREDLEVAVSQLTKALMVAKLAMFDIERFAVPAGSIVAVADPMTPGDPYASDLVRAFLALPGVEPVPKTEEVTTQGRGRRK